VTSMTAVRAHDVQTPGWTWAACPLCGGREHQLLFESRNRLFGTDDVACLRRCRCGMCLTNPQPTDETLARLYDTQEYYTHAGGGTFKERLRERTRRWQLRGPLAALRLRAERTRDVSRFTSRFAPEHFPLSRGLSLLDFGCGAGDIAVLGIGLGMRVLGIEPDRQAQKAAASRGVRVVPSLDAAPAERFDRIIMRHVLEHVPDPVGMLRTLGGRLATDGRMLVAVPNVDAHQAQVYGEHWIGYDMPRHLWHFSVATLRRTAEQAGLRVVWMGTVELAGFAQKSLENTPADRRAAAAAQTWSAREVEQQGRGTEIVCVLEGALGR